MHCTGVGEKPEAQGRPQAPARSSEAALGPLNGRCASASACACACAHAPASLHCGPAEATVRPRGGSSEASWRPPQGMREASLRQGGFHPERRREAFGPGCLLYNAVGAAALQDAARCKAAQSCICIRILVHWDLYPSVCICIQVQWERPRQLPGGRRSLPPAHLAGRAERRLKSLSGKVRPSVYII